MPEDVYNYNKDKAINVFKFDSKINTKQKTTSAPATTTTATPNKTKHKNLKN